MSIHITYMHSTYPCIYCKHGKICRAKHSQFQPYEVFHGNTFGQQCLLCNYSYVFTGNFRGTLKNHENCESLAQ